MKRRLQYAPKPEGMHVHTYDWIEKEFGKVDNVELSLAPLPLPEDKREAWHALDRDPLKLPQGHYLEVLRRRSLKALLKKR